MPLCLYILKHTHHFRGFADPLGVGKPGQGSLKIHGFPGEETVVPESTGSSSLWDRTRNFPGSGGGRTWGRQGPARFVAHHLAGLSEAMFLVLGSPNLRTRPPPRRESSLVRALNFSCFLAASGGAPCRLQFVDGLLSVPISPGVFQSPTGLPALWGQGREESLGISAIPGPSLDSLYSETHCAPKLSQCIAATTLADINI